VVEKIIVRVLESLMGLIYQMTNQVPHLLSETSSHSICRVISPPDEVKYVHEDN
jgi:hypothetical protein